MNLTMGIHLKYAAQLSSKWGPPLKTDNINSITPNDDNVMYRLMHDEFKMAYESNANGIKDIFNDSEKILIEMLIDNNESNDELGASFITESNKLSLSIYSSNTNLGENGLYVVRKQLSSEVADNLGSLSPYY